MVEPTTWRELHGVLLRDTFGRDISDADLFLLFTALHYYRIELSCPQVYSCERRLNMSYGVIAGPLEPRGCAEAIASLWTGRLDVRAEPSYWYCRWRDEWGGYVRVRGLTADEVLRLHNLVRRLESHPFVARFRPDGSQPFPDHDGAGFAGR